jgi:hypothetical protein
MLALLCIHGGMFVLSLAGRGLSVDERADYEPHIASRISYAPGLRCTNRIGGYCHRAPLSSANTEAPEGGQVARWSGASDSRIKAGRDYRYGISRTSPRRRTPSMKRAHEEKASKVLNLLQMHSRYEAGRCSPRREGATGIKRTAPVCRHSPNKFGGAGGGHKQGSSPGERIA